MDDWNPEDDTSNDINPLYQNKYQPKVLFGKGHIAGIDMEEQKGESVSSKVFFPLTFYRIVKAQGRANSQP